MSEIFLTFSFPPPSRVAFPWQNGLTLVSTEVSVRIDNFLPLENWAQGQDSNPDSEPLWAACPHFPGVNPPRAEANNDCPKGEASQTKGIITLNEEVIKVPNRGNKIPIIHFMGLKTTLVSNQDASPEESTGPGSGPMTVTQEQENQVAIFE
ncbi:hypothetical protein DSO57_1011982 [Entomophthora muscae]|uniref:Uncharacterized protein n=1 Tax=Entomophthora muscae TaxID=34485 RepID=A0ACC2TH05_9FUNG|nr:hypothetical protein DSO57_1011982 [Entomophthora muscae]